MTIALRSVLALAACFATAAPAAAQTSGSLRLNFVPPAGWTDTTRPSERPGVWKDWVFRDGAIVHSIVLSVTAASGNLEARGVTSVALFRQIATATVLESGPTTVCGDVPAFAYRYRTERTPGHPMVIRHVLVDIGPLAGDVSYAHPPDVADRPEALDALASMCTEQMYAMQAPPGWRASGLAIGNASTGVGAFTAPDGKATLIALAVSSPPSAETKVLAPTVVTGGATLIADGEESCGAIRVRRARFRTVKDGVASLVETVAGYRHGARYFYTYVRPDAVPADPEAQRALTSFCEAGAALATPAPAPAPTPGPAR